MTARRIIVVSLASFLLTPAAALAHRMDVEARITEAEPAVVRVEAGYEATEPAQEAKVTITDPTGATVAEGMTDDRGVCRLPRPAAGTYTVTVDDGAGHRTSVRLTVPENESDTAVARTTPPNKWAMTAAGLVVIGGAAVIARRVLRKSPASTAVNPEG